MILRNIITFDEPCRGWVTLKLECGHEVGPISVRRQPKARKRCKRCEFIAEFGKLYPGDYDCLLNRLRKVPMDDRALTLVHWIIQMRKGHRLAGMGINLIDALSLAEEPSSYPLLPLLFGDEDEELDHKYD